jgi:hypothetical protein
MSTGYQKTKKTHSNIQEMLGILKERNRVCYSHLGLGLCEHYFNNTREFSV